PYHQPRQQEPATPDVEIAGPDHPLPAFHPARRLRRGTRVLRRRRVLERQDHKLAARRQTHAQTGAGRLRDPRPALQLLHTTQQCRPLRLLDRPVPPHHLQRPLHLQRLALAPYHQRQRPQQQDEQQRRPDYRGSLAHALMPPSSIHAAARCATADSTPLPPDPDAPPVASASPPARGHGTGTPAAPEDTRTPDSTPGTRSSPA